ncbi:hypothetical protein FRC12_004551 [Ceratobasidium sp. 428]|nr:hypothetical protein FRC12_004551 [Ceratobasidium sp. 428]
MGVLPCQAVRATRPSAYRFFLFPNTLLDTETSLLVILAFSAYNIDIDSRMAAVLAPSLAPLPRRAFRDGALLLANRAANLINVPAARNVARELRMLAKAMKPRILQAPAVNDDNAREQTSDLEQYAEFIEDIAERISKLELLNLSGTSAEFWGLLQEFDE